MTWLLAEHFDGSAHCHEVHVDVDARQRELERPGHVRRVTVVAKPPLGATVYSAPAPVIAPAANLRSEDPPLDQARQAPRLDRRRWVRRGAR